MISRMLLLFCCILLSQNLLCQLTLKQKIQLSDTIYSSEQAFNFLDSLLHKKNKDDVRLLILEKRAQRALELDRYDILAKNCFEGVKLSRKLQNDSLEAFFFKFIGISQSASRQYKESILSFKKSARIANKGGHFILEATNYNNIGGLSIDLEEFEQAEYYLKKSINLSIKNGPPSMRNKLLSMRLLSTLYQRTNRKNLCQPLFEKVEKEAYKLSDTNLICSNLVFFANFLKDENKIDLALEKTKKALYLTRLYGDKHSIKTALLFYADLLQLNGNYEEALKNYREAYQIHTTIYEENNQRQLKEFEAEFKTSEFKRQKELAEAKSLVEKQKKNNYFYILLSVVLLSFVIIAIFYIRSIRRKNEYKSQIQEQRLSFIIEGQENERTRISKELHDGIVQDLTALKLNFDLLSKDSIDEKRQEFSSYIKKTADEVRNLSYQMMPITLKEKGLENALIELFERNLLPLNIDFEVNVIGITDRLESKLETSIYRIVQELVNNIIKHSKATEVSCMVKKNEATINLIIEDNGVGFDLENVKSGIGLNSLKSRVDFLNGEIQFESNNEKGLLAYIQIPLL